MLHRIHIHQAAEQNGIYFGQPPILEYIRDHADCTQAELAEFLQVSPPSVATSVKRMQKSGLLEKRLDERDLRINRLRITPLGESRLTSCRRDFDGVDAMLFRGFTQEECALFEESLNRTIQNLSQGEYDGKTGFSLMEEEKRMHRRDAPRD